MKENKIGILGKKKKKKKKKKKVNDNVNE